MGRPHGSQLRMLELVVRAGEANAGDRGEAGEQGDEDQQCGAERVVAGGGEPTATGVGQGDEFDIRHDFRLDLRLGLWLLNGRGFVDG